MLKNVKCLCGAEFNQVDLTATDGWFTCPKCGEIGMLHSQNDHIFCECGFEATYDVYGYLTDKEGKKYTVTELDFLQRDALKEKIKFRITQMKLLTTSNMKNKN